MTPNPHLPGEPITLLFELPPAYEFVSCGHGHLGRWYVCVRKMGDKVAWEYGVASDGDLQQAFTLACERVEQKIREPYISPSPTTFPTRRMSPMIAAGSVDVSGIDTDSLDLSL
jgi:hypothetical protein